MQPPALLATAVVSTKTPEQRRCKIWKSRRAIL